MGFMEFIVAIVAVFMVFLIPLVAIILPIGLIAWAIRAALRKDDPQRFTQEEARLMQDMYNSLNRMEQRLEHLETIVLEKEPRPM